MTKQEAINAMKSGKKVRHRLFLPQEFIYMIPRNNLNIFFEDDSFAMWSNFWELRQGEIWQKDWEIVL